MTTVAEVALIDDDDAVLDSTRLVLEADGLSVATYSSAEAFLAAAEAGRLPLCAVTDIKMPGMSGLELQAAIKARWPDLPLILITGHGEISMAVNAIKAGARDFLEKPFDSTQLVASIRAALDHARQREAAQRTRAELKEKIDDLSARQREVMDLVVQGYSNKEIAAKLGISSRTVETYRLWVMEKTGARNIAELVRMAMMLGDDAA